MTSAKSKEIADEYISSLSDLTINSKPLINMLTMLAEDNMEHAPAIVEAVENHLQKVRSDIKLPVLYLIDSIVKNVNGAYLSLFTHNIVNTFCGVFEKVDENTRASMWRLRQTWNDVFPAKKLFTLDVRVNGIDPAWPITPITSSGSIHVNPRFLPRPQAAPAIVTPIVPSVKLPPGEPVSTTEAVMREQLLKKQKELLELQKKKIELELMQAKASLEQQQRQLDKQVGNIKTDTVVTTTAAITATTETASSGKTAVAPVTNPTTKPVTKQFPAATASLLKNVGANNGPRIAPASSIAVASARPVSRDPRLKTSLPSQESPTSLAELQRTSTNQKDSSRDGQAQLASSINTVLSDQLKQQLLSKQAVTSTINKPSTNNSGPDAPAISTSNNNNADTNLNKSFSGNANKDAVSHRPNQKKDPRLSSNSSGNLSSSKTQGHASNNTALGNRGSGEKSKSSSRTFSTEKSTSSKSSHRKLGNKSRSKQPQTLPNKVPKLDRDASPVRSKSREKDSGDSSPSSRTSPQSSSQSKSRKKSNKSRKRTPSPPYRIPRRSESKSNSNTSGGLTEEEQSGSLIVSPPHPPAFKEIRPNARQRNYVRRNKDDSLSPENSPSTASQAADQSFEAFNKDEDLRATLPVPPISSAVAALTEKKEDLDLRILPAVNTNKRHSSEHVESTVKKSKAEKFDALFGNEDVDLRTLTNPKAGRPPTPPPPVISGEDGKDSWAKLKTPTKGDRENKSSNTEEKRERDRNRDRLGRLRLYNKLPDDPKERRRTLSSEDQDPRSSRRGRDDKPDRNEDRNIEIIMKQAAEQLNQGSITKTQYNTLIQEVLHMSEDRKLKAAQRKEKETGSIVWEKGLDIDRGSGFNSNDNDSMRNKDHSMQRNVNGPRWQNQAWQQPGPWAHPPFAGPQGHYNSDFRPMGPWQNPRHFGPMRPDYQYHGGFNHNIGPNPRIVHSLMGPMGPSGPLISNLLQNGPVGPINLPNSAMPLPGINGPGMMMNNGPINNIMSSSNLSSIPTRNVDVEEPDVEYTKTHDNNVLNRELPPPDPKLLEEIALDTMKSINIDNIPREIRYYGETGVVFMHWNDPREIGFQDGIRRILIDDKDTIVCAFNDQYKEFKYDGEVHRIRLGAPTRELYVDDRWYECYFGGMPVMVDLGGKKVSVKLEGPPPQVKIGLVERTDLVIAKINLIINARNMVPVFLDAKPQMFEIEGTPFTLEFIDALQTVLINGRPFEVEFGGLPKPIHIRDKKHFIRFSILPRNVRPGYVKIKGMRGEEPKDASPTPPITQQKTKTESTPTTFPTIEPESNSQDASDITSTTKPDLQLDMLSSVLPSAMAPASGLSYQAEPVENPPPVVPTLSLPLNMTELFQRLVETGIVPSLGEQKKQQEEEEKKEPEIIPVSFEKQETLRVKQPAMVTALYSGMQCSSCGARFAPELATRYSHHLDWHFRQNRRERDSARKAHSRPWYYDVSDWIQFEEIEDLEDRAQSWFETEKQTAETEGVATDDSPQEAMQPSVPTGSDEDASCHVCHDAFEQFYNEEKEEWHLRPTLHFEGKNFHPLCLEDYKRSLEKSALSLEETLGEMEEEKKNETDENIKDLSVIEESKFENVEDTKELIDEEEKIETEENTDMQNAEDTEEKLEDSFEQDNKDLTILEEVKCIEKEKIEVHLDDEESNAEEESETTTKENDDETSQNTNLNLSFENIKIKEEPVDQEEEQEMQFDFSNVEIKDEPVDPEPDPDESIVSEPATVDTTYAAVKSSIDGNVELESAPANILAAPSRIKINITKPLTSKEPESEPKEKPIVKNPVEETEKPLVPSSIKPALQSKKLSVLPPVEKGEELSGLCTIM